MMFTSLASSTMPPGKHTCVCGGGVVIHMRLGTKAGSGARAHTQSKPRGAMAMAGYHYTTSHRAAAIHQRTIHTHTYANATHLVLEGADFWGAALEEEGGHAVDVAQGDDDGRP